MIENRFKESEFIEHMIVVGENRHFPAALIVPAFEHLKSWCAVKSLPYTNQEEVVKLPQVVERIANEVEKHNYFLGRTEQIKKFRLVGNEWTIESGELSPTLKLRRKFIQQKYGRLIQEIYSQQ